MRSDFSLNTLQPQNSQQKVSIVSGAEGKSYDLPLPCGNYYSIRYSTFPPRCNRLAPAPAAVTPGQITPETRYDQLPEAARKDIDQLAAEMKR